MMSSFSNDDEEFRFFDALEEASWASCSGSVSPEIFDSCKDRLDDCTCSSTQYGLWIGSPQSIGDRRSRFLDWMDFNVGRSIEVNTHDVNDGHTATDCEISKVDLPRSSDLGDELYSSQSPMSNDASHLSEENFVSRFGNVDDDRECDLDQSGQGNLLNICDEKDSVQLSKWGSRISRSWKSKVGFIKKGWSSGFHLLSCINNRRSESCNSRLSNIDPIRGSWIRRVGVSQYRKNSKELSGLYLWQDIDAHKGSILVMKFSPDGQYLASAGEDGIVRVWQVAEYERSTDLEIQEKDPRCLYFTANHFSKLEPFNAEKEKMWKLLSPKETPNSACVVFPPKVFCILEKPLHEFHGHIGEILDLSWSMNNFLLSSSVDKTVRLWEIGSDRCVKVFWHNDYVTCVQFNPIDDNLFISGSIDGKARIWAVSSCQVVDWADIKEIISSICYCPDGQGGVVGSISGICRFYNVSDNHLQLNAQISLHSKKKSSGKRITGLQFLPEDPSKVMVTCADSLVRILHGNSVISKYKGISNAGCQIVASLTSDGKRIVSASKDSAVYVWNRATQKEGISSGGKSIRSCEHFSTNASIAIPWGGFKYGASPHDNNGLQLHARTPSTDANLSSPATFSLDRGFFLESFPKSSATWPEEKLPKRVALGVPLIHKTQYKFLRRSCQNTYSLHAWGLIIVTAGCDGHIKSFHNYGLPVPG